MKDGKLRRDSFKRSALDANLAKSNGRKLQKNGMGATASEEDWKIVVTRVRLKTFVVVHHAPGSWK